MNLDKLQEIKVRELVKLFKLLNNVKMVELNSQYLINNYKISEEEANFLINDIKDSINSNKDIIKKYFLRGIVDIDARIEKNKLIIEKF